MTLFLRFVIFRLIYLGIMKARNIITIGVLFVALVLFLLFRHQLLNVISPENKTHSEFKDSRPNVIVILVDALRPDSLGCYGSDREISPNLDTFAKQSILFEAANSQATCTFPSVNSMLTSRYPFLFIRNFYGQNFGIPEDIPYLPEILRANGYTTLACSASPIVRNTPGEHNKVGGFGRGFDIFLEHEWSDAEAINDAAIKELKNISGPFFLFLHYMDPHDPYDPEDKFKRRFCSDYEDKEFIAQGNPNPILQILSGERPGREITQRDLQHLRDLYDAEVAYFDFQFGRLRERLTKQGIWENSLIVFCADHGEEFLEHESVKHCNSVYQTLAHVPLIIKAPSSQLQGHRNALVQNLDIVPTVLDYIGIDFSEFGFQGKSLKSAMERNAIINPYSFCVQHNWRSINDGRYKLIINVKTGDIAFYDLQNDRHETKNVLDIEAETARQHVKILKEWIEHEEAGLTQEERIRLSEDALEKLKALGYFK